MKRALLVIVEVVHTRRKVLEAGVLADKRQAHKADGAVTLLTDDDFRHVFVLGLGVVHLAAAHKHDHVGVLLDCAGFTLVGVHRAFVRMLLSE